MHACVPVSVLWLPQDDVLDELAEIEAEEERAAAASLAPARVAPAAAAGRDLLAAALDLPSAPTTPVMPAAPHTPVLPDAPSGAVTAGRRPVAVGADDDPDLAELEAMAAGMA